MVQGRSPTMKRKIWITRIVLGISAVMLTGFFAACIGLLGDNVQSLIVDIIIDMRPQYIHVR